MRGLRSRITGCSWCITRRPACGCAEAVGPMVGMNLDPSHLFWMGGDPIEAARVLGEHGAIYHVHGKDSRPERRYWQPNGMLDTKPIDAFAKRSWKYVAVGAGHDTKWWKEFFPRWCVCRGMMMRFLWKWRI